MKTFPSVGIFLCILAFICFFLDARTASAHGKHANNSKETVTASGARDSRKALREFVLHAKAHWEVPVSYKKSLDFWRQILREIQNEGSWKSGTKYLVLVDKQGRVVAHGYYPSTHGRDLTVLRDGKGTNVVQELIEAAGNSKEGGFVDYYSGESKTQTFSYYGYEVLPKASYAVNYTVKALGLDLVLIGGFHHEELIPSMDKILREYVPKVKADSVRDRDTLRNFVEQTARFVKHVYKSTEGNMDIAELLRVSSKKKAWKDREIYLFVITNQGLVVFNGNNPDFDQASSINVVDKNGVNIGKQIIKASKSGGGFLSYLWDNPIVEGDEITEIGKARGTSLKLSYVKQIRLGDDTYILGSGIYPKKEYVVKNSLEDLLEDPPYIPYVQANDKVSSAVIVISIISLLMFSATWLNIR